MRLISLCCLLLEVSRPSLGQIRINRVRQKPNDSIQPFKFEDILPIQNIPKAAKLIDVSEQRSLFGLHSSSSFFEDGASSCDYYTDSLCLSVEEYPAESILGELEVNAAVRSVLLGEEDHSPDEPFNSAQISQSPDLLTQEDFIESRIEIEPKVDASGHLCPSEIKYAKPKRGKTAHGVWKDIVNVDDYTQTIRMEKCTSPSSSCSYVSHHYKSQCNQVYNYHRLLAWTQERGLHMDIFKVPTCCSCHVMGYSYVYPPLSKNKYK